MLLSRQNRLLPILAIVMGLIFLLVLQRACSPSADTEPSFEEVPQVDSVDGDTPSDTLNTLTATVAAMTAELDELQQDNASLRADNAALMSRYENRASQIQSEVKSVLADQAPNDTNKDALSELARRMDALSERLGREGYDDLPIGFGLKPGETPSSTVWIEPLDADAGRRANDVRKPARQNPLDSGTTKVMTVPRNATLMGSTALTAMLGRVPIRGEVRDPMPFKVITGRDNLAANGFTIPGIAGMVWSGTAIGDWNLSCVSGQLHAVTFIFEDGTIRTIASDQGSEHRGGGPQHLGWISDERGVPCVTGERKSNAAAFLSQRVGSKLVEAAAEAAAAAQTTTVIRDSGGIASGVTGNTGDYVLGKTIAGGGAEIAGWLAERQAQAFDAVFVEAGASLVIHVDRELAIDLNANGRKLDYATTVIEPFDSRHN